MANDITYYRTPIGVFAYPHLNRPSQKFGKFEVGITLKGEEAKEVLDILKKLALDTFGRTKAPKVRYPFSKNQDTGEITLKARSGYAPAIFRANGLEYPSDQLPNVGGGTTGRAKVGFRTYDDKGGGITCYLFSVQIAKLVAYVSGGGFGAIEGIEDDGIEEKPSVESTDTSFDFPVDEEVSVDSSTPADFNF